MSKLTDIRAAVDEYVAAQKVLDDCPDDRVRTDDYSLALVRRDDAISVLNLLDTLPFLLAIAEAASEVVHHEVKTVGLNYDGLIKWDKLEAALAKLEE